MFRIKRLYTFMLQTFLPLFFMTFGICLFIVLMQFLWKYIDDMVGKGLEMAVLLEMFFYAALSLVPMALPLAILLASLMTFGNLGERLELLAMKSAGVPLYKIIRPLVVFLIFVSAGILYFQNHTLPIAQVKLYTLLYSMRHTSPELNIPEGVFTSELSGYGLYVKEKDKETGLLKDLMIYDYSRGFTNIRVIKADSGRIKSSADKLFQVMTLYDGESFENLDNQQNATRLKEAVPSRRETFKTKDILIEFDANFARMDESMMSNQYIGKDLDELQTSIDSMEVRLDSITGSHARSIYDNSYKKSIPSPSPQDTVSNKIIATKKDKGQPKPTIVLNYDSIYHEKKAADKAAILGRAKSSTDHLKNEYTFKAGVTGSEEMLLRRHKMEWHKRIALSCACLVFFFIGAPLGSIIRKGGLGMPVVISVFLFIFYYIIDTIGMKLAREGIWSAGMGTWLSTFVLVPLGAFLTYKAVNDSVILNADTYLNALKNLIGKRETRKVEMKEVIMHVPDYQELSLKLLQLNEDSKNYLQGHKRWLHYLEFWKEGGKDHTAEKIAADMDYIVEELSNSDQGLILNKLMDYPVIGGYNQSKFNFSGKTGMVLAVVFPIGLPIYLLATYQRKLLRQDISTTEKVSLELYELIHNIR